MVEYSKTQSKLLNITSYDVTTNNDFYDYSLNEETDYKVIGKFSS